MTTDKNLKLVHTFITALSEGNFEGIIDTLHPNVTLNFPYGPEPLVPRVCQGKETATALLRSSLSLVTPMNFFNVDVKPLVTPGEFICTYESDAKVIATDRPYKNRYISHFTVNDGLISSFTEYFDPTSLVTAFGGSIVLPEV
ncbi:hypothetical protein FNYG_01551 [Fusarium nygamai]|uniref:SnoaL-like domain-containing protein n=1 Tax=Gibberella nygamai TaxID=42673 RepID=A0A2K0WS11_GIBNY|nr:hypothetical protein FNYG_01551 [Fusarium nygamai]